MKKQATLTCVMIVQQLKKEFWIQWEDSIITEGENGNIKPLLEELKERFDQKGYEVSELYGIIHDKDERSVWSQE